MVLMLSLRFKLTGRLDVLNGTCQLSKQHVAVGDDAKRYNTHTVDYNLKLTLLTTGNTFAFRLSGHNSLGVVRLMLESHTRPSEPKDSDLCTGTRDFAFSVSRLALRDTLCLVSSLYDASYERCVGSVHALGNMLRVCESLPNLSHLVRTYLFFPFGEGLTDAVCVLVDQSESSCVSARHLQSHRLTDSFFVS
jgi:hypothetical protein